MNKKNILIFIIFTCFNSFAMTNELNFNIQEFDYLHQCADPVYLNLELINSLKLLDAKIFEADQNISSLLKACNENFKFYSLSIVKQAISQLDSWLNLNKTLFTLDTYKQISSSIINYQQALNNNDANIKLKENNNIECNLLAQDCCTSQVDFDGQKINLEVQPLEVDALTRAPAKVFRQPVVIRFNSNSQNALTVFGSVGFNGVTNFRERATFQKNARVQQNLNVDLNANISGTMNSTNANVSGTTTTTNLVAGSGSITSLNSTTANITNGLTVGGQLLNNGQQVLTNLANLGTGQGVFANKTSDSANLKSLVAGSNIQLTPGANEITISSPSSGSGNVNGPGSSTTNALSRFADTTGTLLKDSSVIVDDSGNVNIPMDLNANAITDGTVTITGGNITGVNTLSADTVAASTSMTIGGSSVVTDAFNEGSTIGRVGIFDTKSGSNLQFKSLTAGTNVQIDESVDSVTISTIGLNGPASSTDNAIVRFDGINGKLIQNSAVTINDSGNISTAGNLELSTNPSSSSMGNITKGGLLFLNNKVDTSNTFVGLNSGTALTAGTNNTAVGSSALSSLTNGNNNIAVGFNALTALTNGSDLIAVGSRTLASNTTGTNNIAVGNLALNLNTTGSNNIAVGNQALSTNIVGSKNIAIGSVAMGLATNTGDNNVAIGSFILSNNTSGSNNTFVSTLGLANNNTTGSNNTAIGIDSLSTNSTGNQNSALGRLALQQTTGSGNIGIGFNGGFSLTTGNNNISVNNNGVAAESDTIRFGTSVNQTKTFIAGIRGTTTTNNDAVAVLIDSAGQLGTISSSARYKEEIKNINSNKLNYLRPVTFKYNSDVTNTQHYGLIAEEVAQVIPELVINDNENNPETVKYHLLDILLINELQRMKKEQIYAELKVKTLNSRLKELYKKKIQR